MAEITDQLKSPPAPPALGTAKKLLPRCTRVLNWSAATGEGVNPPSVGCDQERCMKFIGAFATSHDAQRGTAGLPFKLFATYCGFPGNQPDSAREIGKYGKPIGKLI